MDASEKKEKITVNTSRYSLRTALLADPEISALGTSVFFIGSRVERKLPYIVMTVMSAEVEQVKSGSPPKSGYVECEIHAGTQQEASALMDAVADCLHGFRDDRVRLCQVNGYGEIKYPTDDDYETWVGLNVRTN